MKNQLQKKMAGWGEEKKIYRALGRDRYKYTIISILLSSNVNKKEKQ
jgi:hypothetical protein